MTRSRTQKLKLMVVDDEPDNLDLLYRTFRREFNVFRATGAPEALEILEQEGEMGIIISDQRMPIMNGTEFLSRTVDRFPDTIRILLTGYTDAEDLVGAINSGKVFKYITKPWKPEELTSTIYQAAETYNVIKQRTSQLRRALRQEELVNSLIRAIRESLDYQSTLQTIVEKLSDNFGAQFALLRPLEQGKISPELFTQPEDVPFFAVKTLELSEQAIATGEIQQETAIYDDDPWLQLTVPFIWQQETYAVLSLWRQTEEVSWSATDLQILEAIVEQAALAIAQTKLYYTIEQQAEKMRAELEVARQIQYNLLPQSLPATDLVRVQGLCVPARQVGGDFFEAYQHNNGDIWLAVGDVSGKGVPAALFMASALSMLRRELGQLEPPNPDEIIKNLNRTMADDLFNSNCFITMVVARYQPEQRLLTYANAGHIYPMLWSHQQLSPTVPPQYLKTRGIPIGILPEWEAIAEAIQLTPKDILLITSDGITEATVTKPELCQGRNSMLNQEGLWQLIVADAERFELQQLLQRFSESTHDSQEDDQTILSLEVL